MPGTESMVNKQLLLLLLLLLLPLPLLLPELPNKPWQSARAEAKSSAAEMQNGVSVLHSLSLEGLTPLP